MNLIFFVLALIFRNFTRCQNFWENRVAIENSGWILRNIRFGLFRMRGDFYFILAYWGVNWKVGGGVPDRSE